MKKNYIAALTKDRWIAVNINFDTAINIYPILFLSYQDVKIKSVIEKRYFQIFYVSENCKQLRILCQTSYINFQEIIKPYFIQLYETYIKDFVIENAALTFEEFAWISHFGKNKVITENMLSNSSDLIYECMFEFPHDWDTDQALEKAIPIELTLLYSLGLDKAEIHHFYLWFYQSRIDSIIIENPENLENFKFYLIQEMEVNFQEQKPMLINFISFLLETLKTEQSFEEKWLQSWTNKCLELRDILKNEYNSIKIITPFEHDVNKSIPFTKEQQGNWHLYGYLLEVIHSMLEINGIIELNLLYSLKEGTKVS